MNNNNRNNNSYVSPIPNQAFNNRNIFPPPPHNIQPHNIQPHGMQPHNIQPHGIPPHGIQPSFPRHVPNQYSPPQINQSNNRGPENDFLDDIYL